jgi:hypothetical protein
VVFGHDIGYPDPAARDQDAEHLGEHGGLVDGQVSQHVRCPLLGQLGR